MKEPNAKLAALTRLDLYFSIRQFSRTARRFSEIFSRDFEMVMIFFVVVESCFQAILNLGGASSDRKSIEQAYLDSTAIGLSIFGIGDATGIPRETVRRKVKAMMELGYLASSEQSKNIYVPLSAFLDPKISEAFKVYVGDIEQLTRTVNFYTKQPEA